MSRKSRRRKTHAIQIKFSDEKVTSFGGMILEQRLASRLGLWTQLQKRLPVRDGKYSWLNIMQSGIGGLLSGSRGTYATEELRNDEALLELLELEGAPEEATFWRSLKGLGEMAQGGLIGDVQAAWTRKILSVLPRRDLLECGGFFPVFADGSLLEGSRRREGTKKIKDKGTGLMWTTVFAGPLVGAQALARKGEGEQALVRRLLPEVREKILKPLKLDKKALVLADSLHGNEPTLEVIEREKMRYVVGAGSLSATQRILQEQPASQWHELGPDSRRGWSNSALCVCWIQCQDWERKRLLVGRRVWREGEMFATHYGVMTNLSEEDLQVSTPVDFARKVWRLYDAKGRMELSYKELLSDLGLHHPPCREHLRNAGFYALATLAHTLGIGVKLIGGRGEDASRCERERKKREGAPPRLRLKARCGMRLWRLRRRLFNIPARISRHAHRLRLEFLGVSSEIRAQFECWYQAICFC